MLKAFFLALLSASAAPAARRPVVLVADVGIDDAAAVLLLLRDPTLEILGIAASFGCHGDVRRTAQNARRLLDAAGAGCIPVHVGSRFPLAAWATPTDDGAYIHGPPARADIEDRIERPRRGDAAAATRIVRPSRGDARRRDSDRRRGGPAGRRPDLFETTRRGDGDADDPREGRSRQTVEASRIGVGRGRRPDTGPRRRVAATLRR